MQSRVNLPTTVGLVMITAAASISVACSASLPSQPTAAPGSLRLLYSSTSCQDLRVNSSVRLSAMTYDDGLYQVVNQQAVAWSSSNPAVLLPSVTSGSFTLVGVGTAEARAAYQGRSAAVLVNVPATAALPYLEVSAGTNFPGIVPVTVLLRTSFSAPTTNVTSGAAISSSETDIATVEGSRVTYSGVIGNTEIRATANGLVGACALAVNPRTF